MEVLMARNEMTGLELMQAMINGKLPRPPMAETIPMVGVSAEIGKVTFEVKADARHLNTMGGVHGGFIASVLDTVTGCAIHTTLEANIAYSTIDLNVKMLRPIPLDAPLIAEGLIINKSKRLGVSEGTIKDNDGKIYAYGSATCMIL